MTHTFDASQMHKLDSDTRRQLLPAAAILAKLAVSRDEVVADIGCGTGYFAIPAARAVGDGGKVLAVDIAEEMLAEAARRAAAEGLTNLTPVRGAADATTLPAGTADIALLAFLLHEVDDPLAALRETSRILKSVGRIAVIEWAKRETPMGPPVGHRLDEGYVRGALAAAGFGEIEAVDVGEYFYGLVASRG